MGEKALVEGHIFDAIELIRKLDAENNSPTFAAWYFYDDADDWRFLVGGPSFDDLFPKNELAAYQIIAEAMNDLPVASMSISDVKIVSTNSSLPKTVGIMIQTPANEIVRAHFTDNFVNGIFLKEMFVLRSATSVTVPSV